ncbi:MAG: cytochrome c3 family protein, partial [Methanosarcinales archaeon]
MHKTLRNLTIFILISFTLLTLIAAVATANNSDCGNKGCHANIVENYNTSNQTSHTYCSDCHNETLAIPHTETPVSEPNTCKSCHQNKVNNFTNSKHGYMKCSSCHDVHGNSTKYKSLKKNLTVPLIDISYKDSDFELCYMCHNQTALLLVPNPDQRMIDYKNWFGIPYYTGSWTTDFREMVGAWWDNDNNSEGFQSNLHYDHIARFRGSGSKQWDSNGDGIYEYDSCVTCHDPHGTTNPRFTVLDLNFTWDITNGNNVGGNISGFNGSYCNNCHFYGGNYSRINLTSASIIDSNLTLGGPNCIGCHGLNALYERINESAVAIGIHINITGDPNPSNPNSRCWKCHASDGNAPPEGKHPDRALNPYTCENCHGSTPPASVAPPHIYEHASYGADIATNATCVNCHNNSLVYYGTIPNATITDLYNVAHYGKHPNQGANQVNTTDCNYCHNQSNADIRLKWGNAFQVNSTNMFGATTSSDCYPCHVDDGKIPSNFHIETLNAGGGTDCVTCHDLGKNVPRVDVSAMNNTTYSIHKGLNKDVVTNLTNDSKRCWACHGTGEEPTKHLSDLTKVKYCEDCHNNTNSATNFSAPQVAEHFINGSDIKVLKAKQCPFCHNKTQMKLPYTEPDTKWSNFSLVSHYGKKRTDMNNGTQTDCAYCHTNGGKEFNDTFVKSSNTYITHNGTKQCYECHSSGRFHNESIRGGGNPNCISCHDVGSTGA